MPTTLEYALLAGRAYESTRSSIHLFPTPVGWESFKPTTESSGFEAISFRRGSEIVISYAGTYQPDNNDVLADLGLFAGFGSAQLLQAAEYYLGVQAANPGATITLTGHSLGGGLASLVGVFFGVEAHTFDQAPFAGSALSKPAGLMASLVAKVDSSGERLYDAAALAPLASYIEQKGALGADPNLIPNAGLITNINVQGEFLSISPLPVIRVGTTIENIPNTAPGVGADDLHSQALLTAYLQSALSAPSGQALNEVTAKLPQLLGIIFDKRLYNFNTDDARNSNFLEHLVRHEAGGIGGIAVGGDAMVTRFTGDLNKLGSNVAGLNKSAQDALIVQGIEWYYWQGTDYAGQEFFTQTGELLQYTTAQGASLPGAQNKAFQYVSTWLDPLVQASGGYSVTYNYDQWSVAAGATGSTATALNSEKTQIFVGGDGPDTFTGGDADDMILAGAGADTLNGGAGADKLLGGEGSDTLDGGAGGDWLYGGAGMDTYQLTSGQLGDVIQDSDGNGVITVDGAQLATGKKVDDAYWISDDSKWSFSLGPDGDLTIAKGSSLDRITIRNWKNGGGNQLGITLSDAPYVGNDAPDVGLTLTGDYAVSTVAFPGEDDLSRRLDSGESFVIPGSAQSVFATDNFGNLVAGSDVLVTDNVLFGFAQDDVIDGLTGNDLLAGRAGNDRLLGGAGGDMILGGQGNDHIEGGEGNDFINSAADPRGDLQQIAAADQWLQWGLPDEATVLGNGATWGVYADASAPGASMWFGIDSISSEADRDFIDAGAGDDHVLASAGADRVIAGDGADIVWGLGGNDAIEGGAGDDTLNGDGWPIVGAMIYTTAEQQGADFIDGGSGADIIHGNGGADQLFGGIGNDSIYGDFSGNDDAVSLLPPAYSGNDYIDAGEGDDRAWGDSGNDTLYGGAGADFLSGDSPIASLGVAVDDPAAWGNDFLDGGSGNDTLGGDGGDDEIFGGADDDFLFGDGDDVPVPLQGADYLDGEGGNDRLAGGGGADTLFGGAGNDSLMGDGGNDYLDGEDGLDNLEGGNGDDEMFGGEGDDTLDGGEGADYLDGEAGANKMFGGAGNDTLYGGSGDDELQGNADNDFLDAGAGADTLHGDEGDDVLIAGDGADVLDGGIGSDALDGEDGDDALLGGFGNDTLDGGSGNDTLWGDGGDDFLADLSGTNQLIGGGGNDTLIAGMGNDTLVGDGTFEELAGDDVLDGGGGTDLLDGGAGTNTYIIHDQGPSATGAAHTHIVNSGGTAILQFDPGVTPDSLSFHASSIGSDFALAYGSGDLVYLEGGMVTGMLDSIQLADGTVLTRAQVMELAPALSVSGTVGNDDIVGGNQADALFAGGGDDVLSGGRGNDTLGGGTGSDTYLIKAGGGEDSIFNSDFDNASTTDRIVFDASVDASSVEVVHAGADLVLQIGDHDSVRVLGHFGTGSDSQIDRIEFADGTSWDAAALGAMARVGGQLRQ